jgi:hypothetical protein
MLSSKRSVNMRRAHRTASQRKRREWSTSTTRRPAIGKSAKRRAYWLWTRPETTPQDGHGLFASIARIAMTVLSPSLNASTAENPGGRNSEARRDCMALIPL